MKKLIFILILFLLPLYVKATTKADIIKYVEKESTYCDSETQNMFDSYKVIYERMLNERELTSKELTDILNKLKSVVKIINVNDVCSIKDLTSEMKTKIYDILYDSAMIIFNADNLVYDKSTNTIKIYEDKALIEEIKINNTYLNEVGYSKSFLNIIIINLIIILLVIIILIKINNKKIQAIKNISYSLLIANSIMIITLVTFYPLINKGMGLLNMLSNKESEITKDYKIKNDKIVSYPSIGSNYANINIEKINLKEKIYYGDNDDILLEGIGTSTTSHLIGENKTTILSAHNYYLPNINKLKKNDSIKISTYYKEYTYKISEIKVVNKNYKINVDDKNKIVFYTCYPISSLLYTNKRLLIIADYVESRVL